MLPVSSIGTSFGSLKWFALDPCGLACVSLSYSFHLYALYVIYTYVITGSGTSATLTFYIAYLPCAILALVHLVKVQFTNPGAVPLGARPLPLLPGEGDGNEDDQSQCFLATRVPRRRGIRRCRRCNNNYKPPRSHHDSVTGRCIVKFDHFCPWAGNAIGALNHKFFLLFIFYTFLTSIVSLGLLISRFIGCGFQVELPDGSGNANYTHQNSSTYYLNDINDGSSNTYGNQTLLRKLDQVDISDDESFDFLYEGCIDLYSPPVIGLLFMSISFLVFTCCMLVEQADAIESNTSKIARLKIAMGQDCDEYEKVSQECNEMFGIGNGRGTGSGVALHWFLPTYVRFPEGKHDMIMGYEYKDEWEGIIYSEEEMFTDELGSLQPTESNANNVVQHDMPNRLKVRDNANSKNLISNPRDDTGERGPEEVVLEMSSVDGKTSQSTISRRSSHGAGKSGNDLSENPGHIV